MSHFFPGDTAPVLEQALKSSGLSAISQKLLLDLHEETSLVGCMDNDEKFDAINVRGRCLRS